MSFWSDIAPIGGAVLGGVIGGAGGAMIGGSVGGAISGSQSAKEARERQAQADYANYMAQKEFAQHGIRWKVEDAKAAGIHPLVALGAPTSSFSNTYNAGPTADLSGMGQDVGRAIAATRTADERTVSTLQIQGAQLDIEGKALDNQIKQSQLNKLNAVGPAMPGSQTFIAGQGDSGSGRISEKPLERTMSLPGSPHSEPGAVPDVGWAITEGGALVPVPSNDVKQRIEDNMPQEFMHFFRNNVAPNFGRGPKPPKSALPKGATSWDWDYKKQGYVPVVPRNMTGKPSPKRAWWARD